MTANPSTANAHKQIYDRLAANLPADYSSTDVKWPNYEFNQPSESKWLRISVIDQDVNNVQAGFKWQRKEGLIVIDVFGPEGTGTLSTGTLTGIIEDAETLQSTFQNKRFGGVNTQEGLITDVGFDGAWHHVQLEVDFYYEGDPSA